MDIERHTRTRDRRLATAEILYAQLTNSLRALHGSDTPPAVAKRIVARYARAFGGGRLDDAGADAIAAIVLSPATKAMEIEALDDAVQLMVACSTT